MRVPKPLLPFASGLLVYLGFEFFKYAASIDRWEAIDPAILRPASELALATQDLNARIAWGISCLIFALAWAVSLGGTTSVIAAAARGLSLVGRRLTLLLALGFLVYPLLDLRGSLTVHGMVEVFDKTFELLEMGSYGHLFMNLASALSTQVALLLSLGAGLCLARSRDTKDPVEALQKQTSRLRTTLYFGTAFLVAGTLENLAMHRLPVALAGEAEAESLQRIAESVAGATGTVWTLLLLAIYLPAASLLKAQTGSLARDAVLRGESKDSEEWLKGTGLSSSVTEQLGRLLALMGPFLVGVPGSEIIRFISGTM